MRPPLSSMNTSGAILIRPRVVAAEIWPSWEASSLVGFDLRKRGEGRRREEKR